MFEWLEAVGGIYIAIFAVGVISGVFPLVNSEVILGIAAVKIDSLSKLLVLAVIVSLGQSVTHSSLFFTARGLTKATANKREKLEAKLLQARALAEKWGNKWVPLIILAATVGIPPMILVALAAGALGVRWRLFVTFDVTGRIARFVVLALIAHQF